MKKVLVLAVLLAMLLSAHEALAWGGWAHRFITYTAEKHLEPEVKGKIEKYLGSSMIDHCSWMDEIRKPIRNKKHPEHDYHMPWEHTLAWHMITANKELQLSNERAYNKSVCRNRSS